MPPCNSVSGLPWAMTTAEPQTAQVVQPVEQDECGEEEAQGGGGEDGHRAGDGFCPGIGRAPKGGHAEQFEMHALGRGGRSGFGCIHGVLRENARRCGATTGAGISEDSGAILAVSRGLPWPIFVP